MFTNLNGVYYKISSLKKEKEHRSMIIAKEPTALFYMQKKKKKKKKNPSYILSPYARQTSLTKANANESTLFLFHNYLKSFVYCRALACNLFLCLSRFV